MAHEPPSPVALLGFLRIQVAILQGLASLKRPGDGLPVPAAELLLPLQHLGFRVSVFGFKVSGISV